MSTRREAAALCALDGCRGCGACTTATKYEHNIDHDSLVLRLDHLEGRLKELLDRVPSDVRWRVGESMALLQLLRSQVIK